jgi:hypothetical protein
MAEVKHGTLARPDSVPTPARGNQKKKPPVFFQEPTNAFKNRPV